jgi:hypothetical protein
MITTLVVFSPFMIGLLIIVLGLGNVTNSTLECPANYYGDDEGSPQDLLLRDPTCTKSDSIFEP